MRQAEVRPTLEFIYRSKLISIAASVVCWNQLQHFTCERASLPPSHTCTQRPTATPRYRLCSLKPPHCASVLEHHTKQWSNMQVLIAVVGDNWFKRVNFELQALSLPRQDPPHSHSLGTSSVPMSAPSTSSETSSTADQPRTSYPHSPDFLPGNGQPGMGNPALHDPAAAIQWTEERLREKQRSLRSFETEFRQVTLVYQRCTFPGVCLPFLPLTNVDFGQDHPGIK